MFVYDVRVMAVLFHMVSFKLLLMCLIMGSRERLGEELMFCFVFFYYCFSKFSMIVWKEGLLTLLTAYKSCRLAQFINLGIKNISVSAVVSAVICNMVFFYTVTTSLEASSHCCGVCAALPRNHFVIKQCSHRGLQHWSFLCLPFIGHDTQHSVLGLSCPGMEKS